MQTASERFREDLRAGRYREGVPLVTYACLACKDAGWLRYDVLPEHAKFGQIVECSCGLVARRRAETARGKARGA